MSLLCWVPINDKIDIKVLVTIMLFAHFVNSKIERPSRAYLKLSIAEKIRYHGYPCEIHEILTPDGYNIRLFRIPYGINPTKNSDCDGEYINKKVGNDNDTEYDMYYDEDEYLYNEDGDTEIDHRTLETPLVTTESSKTRITQISTKATASSYIEELTQSPITIIQSRTTTTNTPPSFPPSANITSTSKPTHTSVTPNTKPFANETFKTTPITSTLTSTPATSTSSSAPNSSTKKTYIQKIPRKKKPKRSGQFGKRENDEIIAGNKSVILLLHAILASPAYLVHNGKESTAFYFADRGFDVWLLCFRGNECGQKHLHAKYDKNRDRAFWDFTLHHMSVIDIPTAIDHILPITNQSALHMIGHSAGTITQGIFLSERPEYALKVKVGSHYGGSIFLGRSDYPLVQLLSSWSKVIKSLYSYFGWVSLMPRMLADLIKDFLLETCYSDEYFGICEGIGSIVGSHRSVLIEKYITLPKLAADSQMHLSAKEMFQFMEMMSTGELMKYDYGQRRNLREYGQGTPPQYNLSRVTNPTIIHYSPTDHFADLEDIKRGLSLLPNVIQVYQVPFWRFTHTDYILAKNASKLVYENTCQMFKRYDSGERFEPIKNVHIEEPEFQ